MNRSIESISFTLKISTVIMALGLLAFQMFPHHLLSMFSADEAMYELGVPALRIISLSFVFAGINMVLCSSFQALNHASVSLWITLFRQMILLLPLTYVLAITFGLENCWYSFLFTEISCSLISVFNYTKIKHKIYSWRKLWFKIKYRNNRGYSTQLINRKQNWTNYYKLIVGFFVRLINYISINYRLTSNLLT